MRSDRHAETPLSVLIAVKILLVMRDAWDGLRQYRASPALVLIVESGAIYSIFTGASLAAYLTESWIYLIFFFNVRATRRRIA